MMRKIIALLLFITLLCTACATPISAYSNTQVANVVSFILQEGKLSTHFSNEGQDPAAKLCELFANANDSIDIAVYDLTNPQIITALMNLNTGKIKIRIITDRMNARCKYEYAALLQLLSNGIQVKVNKHVGQMHMNMTIIDNNISIVGSYDYTLDASQTSDAQIVVIEESNFAKYCKYEFDKMWESDQFQKLTLGE